MTSYLLYINDGVEGTFTVEQIKELCRQGRVPVTAKLAAKTRFSYEGVEGLGGKVVDLELPVGLVDGGLVGSESVWGKRPADMAFHGHVELLRRLDGRLHL